MKNDMKLIMENWRRKVLSEQTREEIDTAIVLATAIRNARQTGGASNPSNIKVGDLLKLFDDKVVEEMTSRYSQVGAIIKILLQTASIANEQLTVNSADRGYSNDDIQEAIELIESFKEFMEGISEKLEELRQENRGYFSQALGALTKGIFTIPVNDIKALSENKFFRTVAGQLGFGAAMATFKELIPLAGFAMKGIKILQVFGEWADEDGEVQKAIKAKNPQSAFVLMTSAALTVDDSKRDMMGPLKILDVDDQYQKVLSKEAFANFMKFYVEYLKNLPPDTLLTKTSSNRFLIDFVRRKYDVQIEKK